MIRSSCPRPAVTRSTGSCEYGGGGAEGEAGADQEHHGRGGLGVMAVRRADSRPAGPPVGSGPAGAGAARKSRPAPVRVAAMPAP